MLSLLQLFFSIDGLEVVFAAIVEGQEVIVVFRQVGQD